MGLFTVESEIIINNLTPRRIARSLRAQVGGIVNVGLLGCSFDANLRENVHIRSMLTSVHPDSRIDVALVDKI